jgi:hypothetical protein
MGAPTSAILAEILLQFIDFNSIYDPPNHKIISYFIYVDDIILIYNNKHTDINLPIHEFNNIHLKLQFTTEHKTT